MVEPVPRIVHAHECMMLGACLLGASTSRTHQDIVTLCIVDVLRIGDVALRPTPLMMLRVALLLLDSTICHCLLNLSEGLRFSLLDLVFELFRLS